MPSEKDQANQFSFLETSIERASPGSPSIFSCPDCGGVLWEQDDGTLTRFRCRVGHAYTTESLIEAQDDVHEAALWTALRALEEKVDLYAGMARRAGERGQERLAQRYRTRRDEIEPHIATLQDMLRAR